MHHLPYTAGVRAVATWIAESVAGGMTAMATSANSSVEKKAAGTSGREGGGHEGASLELADRVSVPLRI